MNDLIMRKDVEQMLKDLGGQDVLDSYDRGWESALNTALGHLDRIESANKWIPCSERLPEDFIAINVTWVNREPARGYEHIKDKPFVDTAMRFKGKWYWWSVRTEDMIKEYGHDELNKIDRSIEIIAWQYQPEPWEGENND